MSVDKYTYRYWDWLQARGWKMVPSPLALGTANTDRYNKRINVKPSVFLKPSLRVRRYVIPHEIWHALHAEVMDYACDQLRGVRALNWKSAVEVVADGGCLWMDKSRAMKIWVKASVMWHGKVGYRYKVSDLTCPETLEIIEQLDAATKS